MSDINATEDSGATATASNKTESLSATELYNTLLKICEKAESSSAFSDTDSQIEYILSNYISFERWYDNQFKPVLVGAGKPGKAGQSTTGSSSVTPNASFKSIDDAQKYFDFAQLYKNMTEPQFGDKAFECLNKAIIFAPMDERNFLFECYSQRSSLHNQRQDYTSALSDIDFALKFRNSATCIERKAELLRQLDRGTEAYQMVNDLLNNRTDFKLNDSRKESFRKLLSDLKQFKDGKTEEEVKPKTPSDTYYYALDERVEFAQNRSERFIFKANSAIPNGSEIVSEDPALLVFRTAARLSYCNQCYAKVTNTFWPCSNCSEVVFCSEVCAKMSNDKQNGVGGHHAVECGMIGFIQSTLCAQSAQVYRTFASNGHRDVIKFMAEGKSFTPDYFFSELSRVNLKKSLVHNWFLLNEGRLNHLIWDRKPTRTSVELTTAFFLLAIYLHQTGLFASELDHTTLVLLLKLLSTSVAKCVINEYGWHDNVGQQRVQLGNFQCLVSSMIGHNCDPNAEWHFDGQRFKIKTIKPIQENDEIAITYGITKDVNFFKRQKHLENFLVNCNCSRCMKDVKNCFAVRCESCSGPVPYDYVEFDNDMCIVCSHRYSNFKLIREVQRELESAKRSVWLIQQIDNVEHLRHIEHNMSTLSCYMYLQNTQFVTMVKDLCSDYIERRMWKPAIEWFQWFVEVGELFLSTDDDPLVHFYNLDRWAMAFINYLKERLDNQDLMAGETSTTTTTTTAEEAVTTEDGSEQPVVNSSSDTVTKSALEFIEVGGRLFKRLFMVLELLNTTGVTNTMDTSLITGNNQQFQFGTMLKTFQKRSLERSQQYKDICVEIERQMVNQDTGSTTVSTKTLLSDKPAATFVGQSKSTQNDVEQNFEVESSPRSSSLEFNETAQILETN